MSLIKLNDKTTIEQSQKETEQKEMKIEGLKRDVTIWEQRCRKYSIIGKMFADIISFLITNTIKIIPLVILLFPNLSDNNIVLELISIIHNQVDWKCITPICICICFIFWCNKYFKNKK